MVALGCIPGRVDSLSDGFGVQGKRSPASLTKDLEVDGCILLASFVLGNADILGLVIFIHFPDGQLRTVITEDVLLIIFLVFYRFPISTGCRNTRL